MSAQKDPNEKIAFVYSNLYRIYKRGVETAIDNLPAAVLRHNYSTQDNAIKGLKNNIKQLNDLHARLKFMLSELEELFNMGKK